VVQCLHSMLEAMFSVPKHHKTDKQATKDGNTT
jgi:hypothetical protein